MWIFFNDAFLSIVAPAPGSNADKNGELVVRARLKGDLERAFPGVRVRETKSQERDYRFRATVSRAIVAETLAGRVKRIDYTNFKSSVDDPAKGKAKEKWRHDLYMRVWSVMFNAQENRRPASQKRKAKQPPYLTGAPYGSSERYDLRDDHDPYDPNTWWKPRQ